MPYSPRAPTPSQWQVAYPAGDDLIKIARFNRSVQILHTKRDRPVLCSQKAFSSRIYVPAKRRGTANPDIVRDIAENMLEIGQQTPILVRSDGDRLILVEGLHRLEACKALGEETILGFLVQARVGPQKTNPPPEADALQQKMARLRELRLAQEAAQQASVTTPTSPKEASKKSSRSTKKVSLVEWLAEREFDGGRR